MKILSIVGSPRVNGNTHFLAQKCVEGMRKKGAEVEEIILRQLKIEPCLDCGQCHEDGICKLSDDFEELAVKMKSSDGLLFSTPVYCFNVTGHLKCFMDRCHSFVFPAFHTGLEDKKVAVIITSGFPMPPQEGMNLDTHKIDPEVFFELDRKLRLSTGDTLRCLINPALPFDPTIDTLRTFYQFSAMIRAGFSGFLEVTGLGKNKDAVQHRSQELQKAEELGMKFAETLRTVPVQA